MNIFQRSPHIVCEFQNMFSPQKLVAQHSTEDGFFVNRDLAFVIRENALISTVNRGFPPRHDRD